MLLTAAEVDELFSRVNGVRNDLVALMAQTDAPGTTSALLVETALININRAIDLTAKLLAAYEVYS